MLIEQYAALAILGTFLVAIAVSEFKERRRFPYEDVVDDIELPLHETTISSYSDKVAIGKLHNGDRITFTHRGEKRRVPELDTGRGGHHHASATRDYRRQAAPCWI